MRQQFTIRFVIMLVVAMTGALARAFTIDGIIYVIDNDEVVVDDYSGPGGSVTIPESVEYSGNTYTVTSIGQYAFSGCSGLASLVLRAKDCQIASNAFQNTDLRCAVFLSNSLANSIGSNLDGCEVFAFGDEPIDVDCEKLYTFIDESKIEVPYDTELAILSVGGLKSSEYSYVGKPCGELYIDGNTSLAEMEFLNNSETAVDAGAYVIDELAFSFRYDEYGINSPEVTLKLEEPLSYTISKAPLVVSVSPSSSAITYGDRCPDFSVEYDGFVNGEGTGALSSLPVM